MGGFTRPIAEFVGEAVDRMFTKAAESNHPAAKFLAENVAAMDRTFKDHPIGEQVRTMINKGVQARQAASAQLRSPITNFENVTKTDPALAQMHDYKTASIRDIHNSLPANHPGRSALSPLMANPANYNLTLDDLRGIADQKANLYARNKVFGPDSAYLASMMHPLYSSNSPLDHSRAEAMMSAISQVFKDTVEEKDYLGRTTKISSIKSQVGEAINAPRVRAGLDPYEISRTSKYQGEVGWEKAVHERVHDYLAPLITTAHLSDFFKLPATTSLGALWKTFQTLDDPMINAMKDASGIFNHTMHSIYDHDFNYRTGVVAQKTGSPNAGAIINKIFHQPGFNNLRMGQLSIFGTAAYHQAQIWGKAALHGDRFAAEQLKNLNLDPTAIMRRNGILTDPEMEQAVFHFVNDRLLIDKPLERSKLTQGSPFMRLAFDLHGYATKEARFMSKQLYMLMKHEQYGKLAQFVGTVGVVFPMVAPLIQSMNTLVRDADPEEAKEQLQNTYGHLLQPEGFGDFASTYIDLIAHFAGIGAFWTYLHAAANHRLESALLGPGTEMHAGTAQDIVGGVTHMMKGAGPEAMIPAGRDLLKYGTLPILGTEAAHWLFPKRGQ